MPVEGVVSKHKTCGISFGPGPQVETGKTMRKTIRKSEKDGSPCCLVRKKNSKTVTTLCGKTENVPNELTDLAKEIFSRRLEVSVCCF